MSILDQRKLIESIHPFGLLSSSELDNLMSKIDIAYYTKDTLLISPTLASISFYIIIKGTVNELVDDELHNVYSSGDSFDGDALIYNKTQSKFVVDEELICYEIKKDDFLELMQNKKIQSYFLQDFISRHQQLKEHELSSDLTPFLISKVSDMFLHTPCVVSSDETIFSALTKQKNLNASMIIVKSDGNYGVVTDRNLRDMLLLNSVDVNATIASIMTKSILSIDINDFLFNALLMMTHKSIKHLVVMNNDEIVGVLEQLDLLSYFANHSHLVAVQIDKAESIQDLRFLQDDLKNLIVTLQTKGVKVRYITKMVSTLNLKIYEKVFSLCVPLELQKSCALIVMGSEGREEQTIKTDQDNALIISNDVESELFEQPMQKLNESLLLLGFPKCLGNVMVTNKEWRRDVKSYKNMIDEWTHIWDANSSQNLSIFLDVKFVAGEEKYLKELKSYLYDSFSQRDDVLAHIAKAILHFETPLSMFSSFVLEKDAKNRLDLKKGGIFALVHGVRTLSLQYGISQTNTIERIKELNNRNIIDKTFATELIESFDTLSSIRLEVMLEQKEVQNSNLIDPKKLSKVQRDLLKDSFKIVNKFKKFISFHFHLNMVT